MKQSILVIDDHPIIHDGLKTLLEKEVDFEITGSALSAGEAFEILEKHSFDIAIVDLSLGGTDGTLLIEQIKGQHPQLKILVYSMSEEKLFSERTAAVGADGYVMKSSPPKSLKDALRAISEGQQAYSPDILRRIRKKPTGVSRNQLDSLSNREMDVFKLLGEGLDSAAIGSRLEISRNTVDTHRINIKNKLKLPSGKAVERLAYEVIKLNKNP